MLEVAHNKNNQSTASNTVNKVEEPGIVKATFAGLGLFFLATGALAISGMPESQKAEPQGANSEIGYDWQDSNEQDLLMIPRAEYVNLDPSELANISQYELLAVDLNNDYYKKSPNFDGGLSESSGNPEITEESARFLNETEQEFLICNGKLLKVLYAPEGQENQLQVELFDEYLSAEEIQRNFKENDRIIVAYYFEQQKVK